MYISYSENIHSMLHWTAAEKVLGCFCRKDTDSKGMVANFTWVELVWCRVGALTSTKLLSSDLVMHEIRSFACWENLNTSQVSWIGNVKWKLS